MFLAGVACRGQGIAGVTDGEEIQELKNGVQKTEGEKDQVQRGAPRARWLIGIAIGSADVVERAIRAELRHEQVKFWILSQGRKCARFEVELVDGEGGLGDGESGAVAPDGRGLEDEFASGARGPVRCVVDGVARGDIVHVGAIGAHDGDAGLASFALDYAGHGILRGTCGQAADSEVGGVEEAEFVGGAVTEEEDSADVGCGKTIEEFSRTAAAADAGNVDGDVGGIVGGVASPKETAGHELCTSALRLPGVAVVDLGGALADGFSELAINGADGIVAQLEVELALREIGVRMGHNGSSVADENGEG